MNSIEKFETKLKEFNRVFSENEISDEEKENSRKNTINSLLELLKGYNVAYLEYITKESSCLNDLNCNGNPFDFPFSPDFKINYSDFKTKVEFFHWLLYVLPPSEDYSEALLALENAIINRHNPNAQTSSIGFITGFMDLTIPFANSNNAQKILDCIKSFLSKIDERWYLKDMGMCIEVLLRVINNKQALQLALLNINHPVDDIKEIMQIVINWYEKKGVEM